MSTGPRPPRQAVTQLGLWGLGCNRSLQATGACGVMVFPNHTVNPQKVMESWNSLGWKGPFKAGHSAGLGNSVGAESWVWQLQLPVDRFGVPTPQIIHGCWFVVEGSRGTQCLAGFKMPPRFNSEHPNRLGRNGQSSAPP